MFRGIKGWPGYRVSEFGVVESCRTKHAELSREWRPLKQTLTRDGYRQVHLCCRPRCQQFRVHTLVLTAFVGPRTDGMQACHNNGNREDNRVGNLRWDTSQNNIADRSLHGTTARGERGGRAKIDEADVLTAISLRAAGLSFEKIGKRIGVSKRQAIRICKRQAWVHVNAKIQADESDIADLGQRVLDPLGVADAYSEEVSQK